MDLKKATEQRKKLDDLKCSPGSDIKSQDLPGHGQSRLIISTYERSSKSSDLYLVALSGDILRGILCTIQNT